MAAAMSAYLREDAGRRHLWLLAAAGLVAFAVACGYALAIGELDAFFVTLSLILGVAVLFDFRIGVVLLIVLLPVSASSFFPRSLMGITGLNPLNLMIAATLASYLLRGRLQAAGPLVPKPLAWLYVIPIVAAGVLGAGHVDEIVPAVHALDANNVGGAFDYLVLVLVKPMLIVAVALLIGAAVARSEKPERFIFPIALSVALIAVFQIGLVITSGVDIGTLASRAAGRGFFDAMGLHANSLGRLYAIAYALLLFVWWDTKSDSLKLFLLITLGLLGFALLLTFSRAAFGGALLVSALFVNSRFDAKKLSLAMLAVAAILFLAPDYFWSRVTLGFDRDADAVSAGRLEGLWLPLLPELAKSPLWGSGIQSITWSDPMQIGIVDPVTHPHNAYLEALLDMGVVGIALLLAYFWHVWKGFHALGSNAWLSPQIRALFRGATAGLLVFFVTGMAGGSFRPAPEFAYLWMAIGMMYGMAARKPTG